MKPKYFLSTLLGHGVQGASVLEPLDLRLVEGVGERDVERLAILGMDTKSHGFSNSKLGAHQVDDVIGLDLVIVGWVSEGERKHTLFL